MKLQLLAEDISLSLEEQSLAGLQRIPRAVAEIDRVEHDTKGLQSRIQGILRRLDEAEGSSRESVGLLKSVDAVKGRMEAARDTLQEAAGLAELMASVEEVFATGNIRSMADTLASMRRGLKVVGSVPEFADAPERVAALETRLETLVWPELVAALESSDSITAEQMRDVLKMTGREAALATAYAETRVVRPTVQEWNAFAGRGAGGGLKGEEVDVATAADVVRFAEWLPQFTGKLANRLEQEVAWTASTFPEEHGELVASAWIELSRTIEQDFAARMATDRLDLLIAAHSAAGDGYAAAAASMADASGVPAAAEALAAALAPFDAVRDKYGALESKALAEDLGTLYVSQSEDVEMTVGEMANTVPRAALALAAPLVRCIALTAGTEAAALLKAVDDALVQYVGGLMSTLKRLRRSLGLPGSGGVDKTHGVKGRGDKTIDTSGEAGAAGRGRGNEGESGEAASSGEENIQASLRLLSVSAALSAHVSHLEGGLLNALRELRTALGAALPPAAKPGAPPAELPQPATAEALTPALAALAANPGRARKLRALLDQAAEDPRFNPLPHGTPRAAAFAEAAHNFVLDVLLARVRSEVGGMARRPEWSAAPEESAFKLPTFSAYPQEYMTNAGEYLLSLPQHLEAIAEAAAEEKGAAAAISAGTSTENEDNGEHQPGSATSAAATAATAPSTNDDHEPELEAGEWMAKVAEAASGLLLTEVRSIGALTEPGAAQLAADLEYFTNIVAALSLETPTALHTYAVCCAATRDSYSISVQEDQDLDKDVVRAVAAMRGITLD